AERHLTRAVELEAARFGPMHPGLASILNNLGVVYEHLDNPARAESCYRRAHAIASAVLPPDDPAVVMSEKNLRDFCRARGIPFEQPTAPAAAAPEAPTRAWAPAAPIPAPVPDRTPTASASSEPEAATRSNGPGVAPRTLVIVALIVFAVIVGAIVIATRSRSTSDAPTAAPAAAVPSHGPATPSATPVPSAPKPAPDQQPAARPSQPTATGAAPSAGRQTAPGKREAARPEPRRTAPVASAATPTVVSAQLCRSIETGGDWRCTPVAGALEPGPVSFYTRLKTPTDTKVEHRWYRANRLQQTMTLRIHANQGTGYRTFSRATVSAAGEWMVQLRAMDGTVLHEERFTVASR
ncbi:MAG TPA: DUF2914 domain-containing protein, partial [Chloroflexota bacterium]|nr:DUF2914 domain-containing protein [Chloroflexota bacterium]